MTKYQGLRLGLSDPAVNSRKTETTIFNLGTRLSKTKLEETMEEIRKRLTIPSTAIWVLHSTPFLELTTYSWDRNVYSDK